MAKPIRPFAGVEWSHFLASTDASLEALPDNVFHPSGEFVCQSLQLGEVVYLKPCFAPPFKSLRSLVHNFEKERHFLQTAD